MAGRITSRLKDILDAIGQIELLLKDKGPDDLDKDRVLTAAYERFLEIISEASRHIPEIFKVDSPQVPWRGIADIGNWLRHAYHNVDREILWRIYADGKLSELRAVVSRILANPPR